MKRIIATILAISMVFSFSACNDAEKERYDALSEQISKLTEQIGTLTGEITTLTSELESLKQSSSQSISDLEQKLQTQLDEINILQEAVKNLQGKPIEFTEEAPVYSQLRESSDEKIQEFSGMHHPEFSTTPQLFDSFKDYLKNEFSAQYPHTFWYLNVPYDDVSLYSIEKYEVRAKEILVDGSLDTPYVCQDFVVYNRALGDNWLEEYPESPERQYACSIRMNIVFVEYDIQVQDGREYKFGFGCETSGDTYVNIYLNDHCIGTCFYSTSVYVSTNWFEAFLGKNLIRSR